MPKIITQSDNWDFIVHTEKLQRANGQSVDCWATIRQDTGEFLGNVSEARYGILQNQDFISTIRDSLVSLGLADYVEDIVAVDSGRRIYATYTFPKRLHTLPTKVGDKVAMKLQFANSFDTSITAQAAILAEILRCLNGMVCPEKELSLYRRHDKNISSAFVKDVIAQAASSWESSIQSFDSMTSAPLSDEQGINVLTRLGFAKRMADKIQAIWLSPDFSESKLRTVYALYDAITQHLTHDVQNNAKAPRLEMAASRNRQAVLRLARMVRDPNYYNDMVKALPIEIEATEIV